MAGDSSDFGKVSDLRPSTSGHNLRVKVVDAKTVVERPKLTVVESIVGDETASVVFSAKNEQAELVKPGAYLVLRNAKVDMYRGTMRVVVDSSGKVEASDKLGFEAKKDNNLSLIEFELVPVS
ncbi:hypothetical protein Rsub_01496 [Raphidocelis subcapitata]|uniref:Single-stranded DNA binding protein Ssb-like OB fold domain-containing protein n=1 Tax=Raphidocelis subcapitata TaxID=307507 RepID=A0A2V0NVM8_9CHLO|nr:hypothetical protein Rsub_01496 [Raphidocelis subcapitata]|eukprot:GBF88997.1 hypothetical protein Rsub_01496 [Raphidocelis subcapitata]